MTTVKKFRASQQDTANLAVSRVLGLFGQSVMAGGGLSKEEFEHLAGQVMSAANITSALSADAFMGEQLGTPVLGLGRPPEESQRLADAVASILADSQDPIARLSRLAESEALSASKSASRESMRQHGVTQYKFVNGSNPCGLCKWLSKKSPLPVSRAAITHPGCGCVVVPLVETPVPS